MEPFKQELAASLASLVSQDAATLAGWLEIPPASAGCDLALPCFRLAKEMRMAPAAIAADLAPRLPTDGIIAEAEAVGPYLNVRLRRDKATWKTLTNAVKDAWYVSTRGGGTIVAVDLSSPNIAKPFSMGHLRSTVIGTAIANLLDADGYRAIRINHLGDWGTQFGKMIVAYRLWGDEARVRENPIQELNALYVRFHEEAKANPALDDDARAAFKSLEDGDEDALALWRWIVDESMREFSRTYALLGTPPFDYSLGESFYNDKMDDVVDELARKGLLVKSEGADVVMLEDLGLPPCLIRRSDGATLYPTRDLASAIYRHRELGADRLVYVVGGEQRLHFQQVFAVLAKAGYEFAAHCTHVAFGMMTTGGKKMSTRKGQTVRLQDVLEEAISRARAIIEEKNPALSGSDEVARAIGVGAVVFNDLKTNRLHNVEFALETAVAFEGETGPYVQYTHARACSVLRKAGWLAPGEASPPRTLATSVFAGTGELPDLPVDDPTWTLVKELSLFPAARLRATDEYDPSILAKQTLDICQAFNYFYHECPILGAESELRELRLRLTDAARAVIRAALALLGIEQPAEI